MQVALKTNPNQYRLLREAADLFYAYGYNNTGLSDILKACQVTKPTLYHYFGSKSGLGFAYLELMEDRLFHKYEDWAERKTSLWGYLNIWSGMIKKQAECGKFHGCPFANFAGQMSKPDKLIFQTRLESILERMENLLQNFLEKMIQNGSVYSDIDTKEITDEILVAFEGHVNLYKITGNMKYLQALRKSFARIADRVSVSDPA